VLVEFDDDLARREFIQRELLFFGGRGEIQGSGARGQGLMDFSHPSL